MRVHFVFLILANFNLCFAKGVVNPKALEAEMNSAFSQLSDINTPESGQCWDPKRWNENGFGKTEIKDLVLDPVESKVSMTHEATMTAILFRNAGWSEVKVRQAFQRAAEIYAQCGIRLRAPKVIIADSPEGVELDLQQVRRITDATPANLPKPWIYFLSQPLGVGGKLENAYAFGRNVGLINSHYDTVWMGSYTTTSHYKFDRDPSYSPLAHEIAHVLGDYEHYPGPEKNILSGDHLGIANDKITAEQCAKFKTHDSVTPATVDR